MDEPAKVSSENRSGGDKASTVAQRLIGIGERCELFHDERSDGYAVATDDGIQRILRLRSDGFRRWLRNRYYRETRRAVNDVAIGEAIAHLEAKAEFDGERHTLHNRFAEKDGAVYIDLCDERWRVARVTAEGWEVLDLPPILFRRYSHQQPLPQPERGGNLADLKPFLNVQDDADLNLAAAWLVTSPFSSVPRPILMLHGPHGAAKTTCARTLKSLVDPSVTDSTDLSRDSEALAQVLDQNAIPCFDNLTRIAQPAADMLCRAVTGGASSKRRLYTDSESVIFRFKRAPIATGINIPTYAPDLLNRMLLIELQDIPPHCRRDEREFWGVFESAKARLFGSVLDAIAGILRHRDQVRLARPPRMADFARLACAYAEHSGLGADKMLAIIMDNARRQVHEAIESDLLAISVCEFAKVKQTWAGTASDLLQALHDWNAAKAADSLFPYKPPILEGWPKSAKSLGRRLTVLQTTLAEVGVRITRGMSSDGKSRIITLAIASAKETSEMSETSEPQSGRGGASDVSTKQSPGDVRETSGAEDPYGGAFDVTDVSDIKLRNFDGVVANETEVVL